MQEKHNVFDREDATLGRQLFERILAEEPPYKVVEFDVDTYKYIANIRKEKQKEKSCRGSADNKR